MNPDYSSDSDESYCILSSTSNSIYNSENDGFLIINSPDSNINIDVSSIINSQDLNINLDEQSDNVSLSTYFEDEIVSLHESNSESEEIVYLNADAVQHNQSIRVDIMETNKLKVNLDPVDLIFCIDTSKEERKIGKGHTFRKNHYKKNDCEITSVSRFFSKFDNGDIEVSVSNIDSLFEPSFAALSNVRNRTLKKHNNFEEVLEALESECIDKSVTIDKYNFSIETTYTIPAIGFQLFEEVNEKDEFLYPSEYKINKNNKSDQFIYKGKSYDTSYIYLLDIFAKIPLKPICKLTIEQPTFENKLIKYLDFSLKRNISPQSKGRVRLHSYRYNTGWGPFDDEKEFLEIDLGSLTHVTHIGTAGMYPQLEIFPKRKTHMKKELGKKTRFKRIRGTSPKSNSFVHVVNSMEELAWVTEYDLFYKDESTKRWIFIGRFEGNNDPTGERLNGLDLFFTSPHGLLTRSIRIQPVQYFNKAILRLAVYGIDDRSLQSKLFVNKEEDEKKDTEVIKYTIKSACKDEKFVDGRGLSNSGRLCPCCGKDESFMNKHKKRSNLQKVINEERYSDF